jgi:hypothetical protein
VSNVKRSSQFWKIFFKVKKVLTIIYEVSSYALLILSFESVFKARTLSVLKPSQIARLIERTPKLLRKLEVAFNFA